LHANILELQINNNNKNNSNNNNNNSNNNNFIMTTLLIKAPAKRPRVQFKLETEPPGTEDTHPTPSTLALTTINAAVELHPAPIQRLCLSIFHRFTALKNKEKQQLATNSRLTEATFFPCSAWLAFEIRASSSVTETDKFKTLATSMAEKTLKWKNDAKKAILKVAELETKATCIKIVTLLASSTLKLAKLFLLKMNPEDDLLLAPKLVYYAIDKCGDNALVYFHPPNNSTITISCRNLLATLPQIFNTDDNIAPTLTEKAILNEVVQDLCSLVKKIFIDSWSCQIKAHQTIASERAMTRELKLFLDGATTQQAATVLDKEPSVNPKVLHDLIKTQVQAQNKKLQAELAKLNQKLARQPATPKREPKNHPKQKPKAAQQKNTNRGATNTQQRAPSPKKKCGSNNNWNQSPSR